MHYLYILDIWQVSETLKTSACEYA